MKLTLSGSASEITDMLFRLSNTPVNFLEKDSPENQPIPDIVVDYPEPIVKQEKITKVIKLPPIFDTKIERIEMNNNPLEVISEVKGKVYTLKNSRPVDIFIGDTLYKKFVSTSAAGAYFGKANLTPNIKFGSKFKHENIWFSIRYSV